MTHFSNIFRLICADLEDKRLYLTVEDLVTKQFGTLNLEELDELVYDMLAEGLDPEFVLDLMIYRLLDGTFQLWWYRPYTPLDISRN